MKINYERLAKIVKPYGLSVNWGKIECGDGVWMSFDCCYKDDVIEAIKNNDISSNWCPSVKVLITILHPYYNDIFQPTINKEKLIEVFKKYGGWEVENDEICVPYNNCHEMRTTYKIDELINNYIKKDRAHSGRDIFLVFMNHYEDEFME